MSSSLTSSLSPPAKRGAPQELSSQSRQATMLNGYSSAVPCPDLAPRISHVSSLRPVMCRLSSEAPPSESYVKYTDKPYWFHFLIRPR